MSKTTIVLGKRPADFKHTVQFRHVDGTEGALEVTYRYRTRTEYGQFLDDVRADAGIKLGEDVPTMAELMARLSDKQADHLLLAISGWNLDEPLARDNLRELCDVYPGAAAAVMEDYRLACQEGRLGN